MNVAGPVTKACRAKLDVWAGFPNWTINYPAAGCAVVDTAPLAPSS